MSWCDFIAGWVGGSTGLVCGHPMDTVKVLQQAGGSSSITRVIFDTYKQEGVRGFLKGMFYPVMTAGAINSVFFGIYGVTMARIQDLPLSTYSSVYLAGCAGGTVQLAIACPVELVKIKLQTQSSGMAKYRGPWHCLSQTAKEQGARGLFRGIVPHVWRDGHGFGVYMVLYEALLHVSGGRNQAGKTEQFVAGGLAGMLCWLSVLPFDVVKSRMQADDYAKPKYRGMVDCMHKSYKADGLSVFSRGALAMSLRAFPVNGVTFLVYEILLDNCQRFSKEETR